MVGTDGEDGVSADLAEALMEMQGGEGNPLNFMRFHPQFDQVSEAALVDSDPCPPPSGSHKLDLSSVFFARTRQREDFFPDE